jgi:hypothetical protein
MKRLIPLLVVLGLAGSHMWAVSLYESPDVPTDLPPGTTYLPWDIVRDDSGTYSLHFTHPVNTPLNGLHQLCSGDWLLSVEAPTDLGGTTYDPRDVILFDGVNYGLFFCGGPIGVPAGTDVDAAFVLGPDTGDLVVSFDVPTDLSAIGGAVYDPADLVQFMRTGPGCAGWSIVGPYFDASAATPPVALSDNVTGADVRGGDTILNFDVPTAIGSPDYLPGQQVAWDGAAFSLFNASASWPISSRVDAMAFPPDPGSVPSSGAASLRLTKPAGFPPTIRLIWGPASSAGAEDYGIYEGTIGSWTSHTAIDCHDDGGDLQEDITPQAASSYYLVVPNNPNDEGSYGTNSGGSPRPPGTATCRPTQALDCP